MLMMVSSRNFTLMKEKAEGNTVTSTPMDCLVPLADMLNHNSTQNATYRFDNRQNNFILKTTKKIEKNEEIFINYGHKCNSRFFMNYGFINTDNFKHNTVTLKLHLNAKEDKSVYIK
jgi:protein-histidine N-methyltransferase